ncbi:hypothetical protein Tco_1289477 [Tanacetum coccineum]
MKRASKKGKGPEPIGDVTLRWKPEEETLLAKCFVPVFEDRNAGRSQPKDTLWFRVLNELNRLNFQKRTKDMLSSKWGTLNHHCQKFNAIYKMCNRLKKSGENEHAKWDAPDPTPVDLTEDEHVPPVNTQELFGPDARPLPPGKERLGKKTKSDTSANTGGSSSSSQFGEFMSHELRLKREAAEKAFEVAKEKDRTITRLEVLRFLALSTKDFSDDDAYYINLQKEAIKQKLQLQMSPPSNNNDDNNNDDDDETKDEE